MCVHRQARRSPPHEDPASISGGQPRSPRRAPGLTANYEASAETRFAPTVPATSPWSADSPHGRSRRLRHHVLPIALRVHLHPRRQRPRCPRGPGHPPSTRRAPDQGENRRAGRLSVAMRQELDQPEVDLAEIAAQQHGVVTYRQLLEVGLEPSALARRSRSGRLHRLYRGVYAVGYPSASRESRWMAAVLACGHGAVLSHMSAAALWGLLRPEDGPVDVSTSARSGRARRVGIRLHRSTTLMSGVVMKRFDIPVTTPACTDRRSGGQGAAAPGAARHSPG